MESAAVCGVGMNLQNRWVRMSQMIPRAVFEELNVALFYKPLEGNPAKSARIAIIPVIIKKRVCVKLRLDWRKRQTPFLTLHSAGALIGSNLTTWSSACISSFGASRISQVR